MSVRVMCGFVLYGARVRVGHISKSTENAAKPPAYNIVRFRSEDM